MPVSVTEEATLEIASSLYNAAQSDALKLKLTSSDGTAGIAKLQNPDGRPAIARDGALAGQAANDEASPKLPLFGGQAIKAGAMKSDNGRKRAVRDADIFPGP